jgi:hypothetical protein
MHFIKAKPITAQVVATEPVEHLEIRAVKMATHSLPIMAKAVRVLGA